MQARDGYSTIQVKQLSAAQLAPKSSQQGAVSRLYIHFLSGQINRLIMNLVSCPQQAQQPIKSGFAQLKSIAPPIPRKHHSQRLNCRQKEVAKTTPKSETR